MEGDLQKTLGRNLRRHREAKDVSQEDFAHELGFHRIYTEAIERGKRNPSLRSVERLAQQLGIDLIELLGSDKYLGRMQHRPARSGDDTS